MPWKPKEKELTPQQAVEIARTELSPFWYGVSPQICGVQNEDDYILVPLDNDFVKKNWFIMFIDPTQYTGTLAVLFSKEWHTRYAVHHLHILLIMIAPYSYWENSELIRDYMYQNHLPFPLALDRDRTLSKAFGVDTPPQVILLSKGKKVFEFNSEEWSKQSEKHIQDFIRLQDPGLSMFPPFQAQKGAGTEDCFRIEFGFKPKLGVPLPLANQTEAVREEEEYENPYAEEQKIKAEVTRYEYFFEEQKPNPLNADKVFFVGHWEQFGETMTTKDPKAELYFISRGSAFSLIAQSLSKTVEVPTLIVELDGEPVYESVAGEHLTLDDTGSSVVKVRHTQAYQVVKDLPARKVEVSFRFTNADVAPVALYGMRFGS